VDHEYLKGMAINPLGHANEIDTPKVQTVLKELENEGLIKLLKRDDQYLEVLHD
jgi:hypothetical protein